MKNGYIKMFASENDAMRWMRNMNRAFAAAGNRHSLAVVAAGPENNWAVMDLASAIELGNGYCWDAK